jgi:hypothetical protein
MLERDEGRRSTSALESVFNRITHPQTIINLYVYNSYIYYTRRGSIEE